MSENELPTHPADRLLDAIEQKRAPVCVGLDPVIERMPLPSKSIRAKAGFSKEANRLMWFCVKVFEAISSFIPCVKIQSACFERLGLESSLVMHNVVMLAKTRSLQVIFDAKRGDIGLTAEHYAHAAFSPSGIDQDNLVADWLTINSYLGEDGITPFLKHDGHGAFALVRTSNLGGDAIQNLQLKDGRTVAEAVGEMIANIGSNYVGQRGYSSLGAVVGATKREDAARLRKIMPQQMFLVPGYGAQGGGLDDVLPCFKSDGTGAIVTASRSVIYAFKPNDPKWMDSVADAAAKFAEEIGRAVGMR